MSSNIKKLTWNTVSDKIASVIAIIILMVVCTFPFFVWALLWKKITSLKDQSSVDAYGSTYNEIRVDSKSALMYNVFYMLRRLWIALIATMLKEFSFLQVQLIVLHSIVMTIYVTLFKPFELPLLNRMEVFNEYTIMLATVHLLTFTQFVPEPETQYIMGWSIIGITVLNIAVNMFVMFYSSLRQLKLAY